MVHIIEEVVGLVVIATDIKIIHLISLLAFQGTALWSVGNPLSKVLQERGREFLVPIIPKSWFSKIPIFQVIAGGSVRAQTYLNDE